MTAALVGAALGLVAGGLGGVWFGRRAQIEEKTAFRAGVKKGAKEAREACGAEIQQLRVDLGAMQSAEVLRQARAMTAEVADRHGSTRVKDGQWSGYNRWKNYGEFILVALDEGPGFNTRAFFTELGWTVLTDFEVGQIPRSTYGKEVVMRAGFVPVFVRGGGEAVPFWG